MFDSREYMREWRKNHVEKTREYSRRWRAKNPGRMSELSRKWRSAHPKPQSAKPRQRLDPVAQKAKRVQQAIQRQKRVRKIHAERITAMKVNRPCVDCGGSFPPYVMDFDHVRGEKLGNIGDMINRAMNFDRILAEIAKCDLVCANCHRIRSHHRRAELNGH